LDKFQVWQVRFWHKSHFSKNIYFSLNKQSDFTYTLVLVITDSYLVIFIFVLDIADLYLVYDKELHQCVSEFDCIRTMLHICSLAGRPQTSTALDGYRMRQTTYCLLVRYSFILGSQNVDFFGYLGRYNKRAVNVKYPL
jgi:hypothetical protein